MKKWTLFLSLFCCFYLLTGCAFSGSGAPVPGGTSSDEHQNGTESSQPASEKELIDEAPWVSTFRIVSGVESGSLLLAEHGEAGTGVYTLNTQDLTLEEPLRDGQLINVYFETVMETYPAQFEGVSAVELVEGGFDDRCALYLDVLEDLWEVDSGLNGGVEVVGVDLSETSLSPAEQAAVAWTFAENHGVELLTGTLDQLMEEGYITGEPLGTEDAPADAKFWHWEDGCFFSITEQPMEGTYSLVPVTFDAMKWRSSLGAYWFSDCTALQSALGQWSDYQVGAEMIS